MNPPNLVLVKISGRLVDSPEGIGSFAEDIASCLRSGLRIVIVHGGGKPIEDLAKRLDIPQRIVNGRRVTDAPTLDLAKMVFSGLVSSDLVAALHKAGLSPLGISGASAGLIQAQRRPPVRLFDRKLGHEVEVDFGFVGDITAIRSSLLVSFLDLGLLPVVASLGISPDGCVLNINADTVAAALALALRVDRMIVCSDTDGIYADPADPTSRIPRLSLDQGAELLASGAIQGGMLPKLSEALDLVKQGISEVRLIDGMAPRSLSAALLERQDVGTQIVASFKDGGAASPRL